MYKNELDNEKLSYYFEIGGEKVPVTEAVYRSVKRSDWNEWKKIKRHGSSGTEGPLAAHLSIERMLEEGLDIPMRGASPEDIYIWKETVEALHQALSQLTPDEKSLLEFFMEGSSDRKIAAKTGVNQTTVSYRRRKIMQKLHEKMKDFE